MNTRHLLGIFGVFGFFSLHAQQQQRKVFTTTPVYDSIIATYTAFDKQYRDDTLLTYGTTDVGKPLQLYVLSKQHHFSPPAADNKKREAIIFVNNGIHPGEPDGIDACIELVKAIHAKPALLPDNVILLIVPVYNVDGCLNRGCCSRANQNGPEEYGFRSNAKNLDLNRDFIKCDASNTQSLQNMLHTWNPDVFVDTHVSDGADYQHTITLIATQRDKLEARLSDYQSKVLVPALNASMKTKKNDMCPYVETKGETPETGLVEFLETPRFSTGYTTLFNTIGFVVETHMWKPYNDRVWATFDFLQSLIAQVSKDSKKIMDLRATANTRLASVQQQFPMNWELDTTKFDYVSFKGYAAKHKASEITGLQRLYYDHSAPYTKQLRFYDHYRATDTVTKPYAYIVPQAWSEVVDRLRWSGVHLQQLQKDTLLNVQVYYIDKYETGKNPYEGHYTHSNVSVRRDTQQLRYYKGDYVLLLNSASNRYLVETLEPESRDGFFTWGFFDAVLQQKEWFSDYIFEEKAEELLKNDPKLKADFDAKRSSDKTFAADQWAQLNFIYQHSPYKEKSHNRYPVARLNSDVSLPITQ